MARHFDDRKVRKDALRDERKARQDRIMARLGTRVEWDCTLGEVTIRIPCSGQSPSKARRDAAKAMGIAQGSAETSRIMVRLVHKEEDT
mgnify:CR=1 FL=1